MSSTTTTATKSRKRLTKPAPSGGSPCVEQSLAQTNLILKQQLAQQRAKAEESARRLYDLGVQLTQVEESERRRLAEVLHDDLQQTLSAAYLRTSMVRQKISDAELTGDLVSLEALLGEAVATSRSLISGLCPPILYEGDFAAALNWLAHEAQERHGLAVSVSADAKADPGSREVRAVLLRGVRELLFNAAKHAEVHSASVVVARAARGIRIIVEDQGAGFDPATSDTAIHGGFGLFSLRERMASLGGSLEIVSSPGHGTLGIFIVPSHPPRATQASDRQTTEAVQP